MKNKLGLILLLIAAAAVVFTLLANSAKRQDYENWRRTDGVVTQAVQGRHFRIRVYYDFTVDGEKLSSWESLHIRRDSIPAQGSAVSVWYDPENIRRTSLSKPEVTALDSIAPLFPVTVLLVAVILSSGRSERSER